jgi:hypothetical protein
MPPISLIHPDLLARQSCQEMSGLALRMHLMDEHGWTVAMILTRRLDHDYLLQQHHDHETKP